MTSRHQEITPIDNDKFNTKHSWHQVINSSQRYVIYNENPPTYASYCPSVRWHLCFSLSSQGRLGGAPLHTYAPCIQVPSLTLDFDFACFTHLASSWLLYASCYVLLDPWRFTLGYNLDCSATSSWEVLDSLEFQFLIGPLLNDPSAAAVHK